MDTIILSGKTCTGKTTIAHMLNIEKSFLLLDDIPWAYVKKKLKENKYDFIIIDDPLNQRQSVIDLVTEKSKQVFCLYLSNEIVIDRISENDIRNMVKQEIANIFTNKKEKS